MLKITFIGAGSTVFCENVLGDIMLCESTKDIEIALYDIDAKRLEESRLVVESLNKKYNESRAKVLCYVGVENRKAALKNANFVINAIQVGGYKPCTVIDFEIPKKYGVQQTIADTLGIGGIFRGLRTITVMKDIAKDIEEVCPNALFLNYTNPMAIITGYMQRFTNVNTIGLCHSVQVCSSGLLESLGMDKTNFVDKIAGINHMGWLLEIKDKDGNDLYPEIRRRAIEKNAKEKHGDMVRFEYIKHLGYYCTESSEHNAEYNNFFIKPNYPELIDKFNIPIDEYLKRCVNQINEWEQKKDEILNGGDIKHDERSREYASRIIEAIVTNKPYTFGGNVINTHHLISNLPEKACVELPCVANGNGITPTFVGELPPQLAAMNMTNINPQLLTIEAAATGKKEHIYHAAMLDPHTSSVLSIDDIVSMCDELFEAHEKEGFKIL